MGASRKLVLTVFSAVVAALASTSAVVGAFAAAPLSVDAFFEKPALSAPEISPNGRYVAMIRRIGSADAIVVRDLEAGVESAVTYSANPEIGFDWVRWKGDDRLLVRIWLLEARRRGDKPDGKVLGYRYGHYIQAIDRDGKNSVAIFQGNPPLQRSNAPLLSYLDGLRSDPDHILVNAPDDYGNTSVWKANVRTGAAALVEVGDRWTVGWNVDRNGDVVVRTRARNRSLIFEGRPVGAARWGELLRIRARDNQELPEFEIIAPAPEPGQFYVAANPRSPAEGDTRTLRLYDVRSKSMGPALWPPLKYDLSRAVLDNDSGELTGVCYVVDALTCDFRDAVLHQRFQALVRYFQGQSNLSPVSHSDDGRRWIVGVSGAASRGSYYLFDAQRNKAELIGDRFPALSAARLGSTRPYTYVARDGVAVPGYLTRPPGAGAGALPTVVLPHGGPEVRDSLSFDVLAQFLATRGYLVFQPNFRGSGGYGRAYAEAGYGQWGGRMQDDITDGVKALIADGQAKAGRICIVGGSYGGYAALYGAASTPDLFRCAVSWNGASDLLALMRFERRIADENDPMRYNYWLRSIGDPESDRDRLVRTSPITLAAQIRAPVLLLHGEADDVVPVEQSRAMHKALSDLGKPVRLVTYKEEGHSAFTEANAKNLLREIAAFLEDNLGGAVIQRAG